MIIVDTNVVSALMQSPPEELIANWLDAQPTASLWITTISIFEVRYGISLLPKGRRRDRLARAFHQALEDDFEGRVLPFDEPAAGAAAEIAAHRRRMGRPIDIKDVQIAGIAHDRRATLATRNARDFARLPFKVINPWADA